MEVVKAIIDSSGNETPKRKASAGFSSPLISKNKNDSSTPTSNKRILGVSKGVNTPYRCPLIRNQKIESVQPSPRYRLGLSNNFISSKFKNPMITSKIGIGATDSPLATATELDFNKVPAPKLQLTLSKDSTGGFKDLVSRDLGVNEVCPASRSSIQDLLISPIITPKKEEAEKCASANVEIQKRNVRRNLINSSEMEVKRKSRGKPKKSLHEAELEKEATTNSHIEKLKPNTEDEIESNIKDSTVLKTAENSEQEKNLPDMNDFVCSSQKRHKSTVNKQGGKKRKGDNECNPMSSSIIILEGNELSASGGIDLDNSKSSLKIEKVNKKMTKGKCRRIIMPSDDEDSEQDVVENEIPGKLQWMQEDAAPVDKNNDSKLFPILPAALDISDSPLRGFVSDKCPESMLEKENSLKKLPSNNSFSSTSSKGKGGNRLKRKVLSLKKTFSRTSVTEDEDDIVIRPYFHQRIISDTDSSDSSQKSSENTVLKMRDCIVNLTRSPLDELLMKHDEYTPHSTQINLKQARINSEELISNFKTHSLELLEDEKENSRKFEYESLYNTSNTELNDTMDFEETPIKPAKISRSESTKQHTTIADNHVRISGKISKCNYIQSQITVEDDDFVQTPKKSFVPKTSRTNLEEKEHTFGKQFDDSAQTPKKITLQTPIKNLKEMGKTYNSVEATDVTKGLPDNKEVNTNNSAVTCEQMDYRDLCDEVYESEIRVYTKEMRLEELQRAVHYKELHDVDELSRKSIKWKNGCKEALWHLLEKLRENGPITMSGLLARLNIPLEMVDFDSENDCLR